MWKSRRCRLTWLKYVFAKYIYRNTIIITYKNGIYSITIADDFDKRIFRVNFINGRLVDERKKNRKETKNKKYVALKITNPVTAFEKH